jgi:hypothetical protein
MQTIIVAAVILISAFYLVHNMLKSFKKNRKNKCSGCSED